MAMGEQVLITGASGEIGRASVLACAAAGFRVIATMRDLSRGNSLQAEIEARQLDIEVEQLDVTAPRVGVKVRELLLKYGPIYGLVNNAGMAVGGVFEQQSERDIREQFEINVFGMMAVTRALLPSMRVNRRGRIVNISSISGLIAFPGLAAYTASKHAVEGFSEALQLELEQFGIQVCVVEPGRVRMPLLFSHLRRGEHTGVREPYRETAEVLEKAISEAAEKAADPELVGSRVASLLTVSSPAFRTVIGRDARTVVALRSVVPDQLFASGMRRFIGLPSSPLRPR